MERKTVVDQYRKALIHELRQLEKSTKNLQNDVITKKYFGIEKLNPVSKLALEILTGKLGLVNDVPSHTERIMRLMKNSKLNPDDLYRETSRVLREWIKKKKALAIEQRKNAKKIKTKQHREEALIRAIFSELLGDTIEQELLLPLRYDVYPSIRTTSVRTTCGAECVDGHPCQHTVWAGWICWQHGGAYVGTA